MRTLQYKSTKTVYRRLSAVGSNTVSVHRDLSSKYFKRSSTIFIVTLLAAVAAAIFLVTSMFDYTSTFSQSSDHLINKNSLINMAQEPIVDKKPTNQHLASIFNNQTIAYGTNQIAHSTDVIQQLREVRMKNLLRGTRRYQLTTKNQKTSEETQLLASKISQWERSFQNSTLSRPN